MTMHLSASMQGKTGNGGAARTCCQWAIGATTATGLEASTSTRLELGKTCETHVRVN